jgi:hypothetical protein
MKKQDGRGQWLSLWAIVAVLIFTGCSKEEEAVQSSVTISGISPESGGSGTTVTITGTGFSATIAENVVKFNGKEATIKSAIATQLVAVVPADAGTGNVTVQLGGKTATGPAFTYVEGQVTKKYYIKFKVNGSWKVFEEGNPGFQSCGECACSFMPVLNTVRYSGIEICQANQNWVTASNILSWDQKTIPFKFTTTYPIASFGFTEDGVAFNTYEANDQTGSSVKVTKIESDGEYLGKKAYKVTGTFQCKVATKDGASVTSITEGEFVHRYSED